jgi:hypothetical protein
MVGLGMVTHPSGTAQPPKAAHSMSWIVKAIRVMVWEKSALTLVSGSWIAGSVRAVLATVVMVATRKMVSFRRGGREGG